MMIGLLSLLTSKLISPDEGFNTNIDAPASAAAYEFCFFAFSQALPKKTLDCSP